LVRFPTPQRAASQSPVPTVVREGEGTGLPQKRAPPYHTARQSVHGASQHCRIKISVSSDHVARSPRRQRLSGPCSTLRGASMLKPCLAAHAVLVDPKRVRSHHNGGSPHSWSFRGGGSCRSDPLPLISTAPLGRGLRATARGATRMGMQQQASISAHHLPRSTSLWVGTGAAGAHPTKVVPHRLDSSCAPSVPPRRTTTWPCSQQGVLLGTRSDRPHADLGVGRPDEHGRPRV